METFDYDNILLLPRKCRVESRSGMRYPALNWAAQIRLPVVPANMKTVVDESICEVAGTERLLLCHAPLRPGQRAFARTMKEPGLFASISLGVKAPDYATVDQLVALGPEPPSTSPSTSPTAMPTA